MAGPLFMPFFLGPIVAFFALAALAVAAIAVAVWLLAHRRRRAHAHQEPVLQREQ